MWASQSSTSRSISSGAEARTSGDGGGGDRPFLLNVPGAQGQPHVTIEGGGHFLQEDKGPELAALLNGFIAS